MYGLIGRMTAVAGQRDRLIAVLLRMTSMPGCQSYVVALDTTDEDSVWVTEVWDSNESHEASLRLPDVIAAIDAGKPMIAAFETLAVTEPVGGIGLNFE